MSRLFTHTKEPDLSRGRLVTLWWPWSPSPVLAKAVIFALCTFRWCDSNSKASAPRTARWMVRTVCVSIAHGAFARIISLFNGQIGSKDGGAPVNSQSV